MKHEIHDSIKMPAGVQLNVQGTIVSVNGKKGTLQRQFVAPGVTIKNETQQLIFQAPKGTLREKRTIKTFKAHLKNMIMGVTEGYKYELKICSGHFPMSVAVEGNKKVTIKNFLGEKVPRGAIIDEGVTVKVEGDRVICEGADKERVGQTAARIEKATRIKGRDRRVFQDGIYIIGKAKSAS